MRSVRTTGALVIVLVAMAELIGPPVAVARPTCQSTNSMTICETNGSVSIKARPGTVAPPANVPFIPWWGVRGGRRR